jgi:hypothetical protein
MPSARNFFFPKLKPSIRNLSILSLSECVLHTLHLKKYI